MDDGAGGVFVPLTGFTVNSLASTHTVSTGIIEGATYRVRFRALNDYGWGPYSDTVSLLAAQEPSKPKSAPVILWTSDTQISLQLDLDVENGGAPITSYELEINAGGENNDVYRTVTSYPGTPGSL